MSKDSLSNVIREVGQYLDEFQWQREGDYCEKAAVNNSELSTRYIAVDPILRALGWDPADPDRVVLDYHLKRWRNFDLRPDYVFKNPAGEIIGILEAKRVFISTESKEVADQMNQYLRGNVLTRLESLRFTVVTNGQYWTIGYVSGDNIEPESSHPLGIQWLHKEATVNRLWNALSSSQYGW